MITLEDTGKRIDSIISLRILPPVASYLGSQSSAGPPAVLSRPPTRSKKRGIQRWAADSRALFEKGDVQGLQWKIETDSAEEAATNRDGTPSDTLAGFVTG